MKSVTAAVDAAANTMLQLITSKYPIDVQNVCYQVSIHVGAYNVCILNVICFN